MMAGCLVAICAAELTLRVFAPQSTGPAQFQFHPALGQIPVPNQIGFRKLPGIYEYTYSNDQDGHRVVPFAPFVKSAPRVLFLGDSFTYGIGVNDDETFVALLQRKHQMVRMVNAGNGGKGTDYALKYLRERGEQLKPKLIILGFFRNDFCDNVHGTYFDLMQPSKLIVKDLKGSLGQKKEILQRLPGYNWAVSNLHTAGFIKQRAIEFFKKSEQETPSGLLSDGSIPSAGCATDRARELTEVYIREIAAVATSLNSQLYAVYIPQREEVLSAQVSADEESFDLIVKKVRISSLSLREAFHAQNQSLDELYLKEGHWSAAGHALAAAAIEHRLFSDDGPRRLLGSGMLTDGLPDDGWLFKDIAH